MVSKTIVIIGLVLLLVSSSTGVYLLSGGVASKQIITAAPLPPQTLPPVTKKPKKLTTAPTPQDQVILVPGGYGLPYAYRPVYVTPGTTWPRLVGRYRQEVVSLMLANYPNLTLRVLPYGAPVEYDVNNASRVTIIYEPWTDRAVVVRVG